MPKAVMLFAAGFGTRMRPLTDGTPKPLLEVTGEPLLDHALALVDQAGMERIVVNTHYLGGQIAQHLEKRPEIAISQEAPDILETGGGLKHALPMLGAGPVFTLNTDAVWTGANPVTALRAAWDPDRMDALLMLVAQENARGHAGGDFLVASDGQLSRGPGAIYTGVQILKTEMLADIPDKAFSLNLLWNQMLDRKRLYGIFHDGMWCDVGRPESIALAESMLSAPVRG